jgi:hypothetical protein
VPASSEDTSSLFSPSTKTTTLTFNVLDTSTQQQKLAKEVDLQQNSSLGNQSSSSLNQSSIATPVEEVNLLQDSDIDRSSSNELVTTMSSHNTNQSSVPPPIERTQVPPSISPMTIPIATPSTHIDSLSVTAVQQEPKREEKREQLFEEHEEISTKKEKSEEEESRATRRSSRLAQTPKPTYNEKLLLERTRKKSTLHTKREKQHSESDHSNEIEPQLSTASNSPLPTTSTQTTNPSISRTSTARPKLKHHPFAVKPTKRTQKRNK